MKTPKIAEGALLLCLDMQPVFLRAVEDGGKVLRRCQFAVASARALGVRVAFTEQVPEKLGATDPALLGLVEAPEVHPKSTFSALATGSPVAAKGDRHLLLCGVETPICVYQTAVDALGAGLEVTILRDCVGARREADAATCLEALARAGALVLPSESVFYSILGAATHPSFRAYTQLVKEYA